MNVFTILAHPERRSFNGALFDTANDTLRNAGHTVVSSDLYRMDFEPRSDRHNFTTVANPDYFKPQAEEQFASDNDGFSPVIAAELAKLEAADLMIWQFPLWWFGLPAILKGWVDRVFAMGRVYGGGRIYDSGLFKGKKALLSLTTGGPRESYLSDGFNGDLDAVLRPIQRGMLEFTGFSVLAPEVHWQPVRLDDETRAAEIATWADRLRAIDREEPILVGRY